MKKSLLLLMLMFTFFTVNAQSVSLPKATITPLPLDVVENNGTGVGSIKFGESAGVDVPAESFTNVPNVTISVSLRYIELTGADANGITGTLLKYFSVSYEAVDNVLTFSQSAVIPGGSSLEVNFPITVTQNSTKVQSYNGFNANINATDINTRAKGNVAVSAYTQKR